MSSRFSAALCSLEKKAETQLPSYLLRPAEVQLGLWDSRQHNMGSHTTLRLLTPFSWFLKARFGRKRALGAFITCRHPCPAKLFYQKWGRLPGVWYINIHTEQRYCLCYIIAQILVLSDNSTKLAPCLAKSQGLYTLTKTEKLLITLRFVHRVIHSSWRYIPSLFNYACSQERQRAVFLILNGAGGHDLPQLPLPFS